MVHLKKGRKHEQRMREIYSKLTHADVPSKNDEEQFLELPTWEKWHTYAKVVKTHDHARGALHYGFQALYDALRDENVWKGKEDTRKKALEALEQLVGYTKTFLREIHLQGIEQTPSHYPLARLRTKIGELEGVFLELNSGGIPYRPKERFAENPDLNAEHIHSFVCKYISDLITTGNQKIAPLRRPDYIIGCATGSFEVVATLSGVLRVPAGFIRFSSRRKDSEARGLPEHEASIAEAVQRNDVLVVEDYVLTGKTLEGIMRKVEEYKPRSLVGASIGCAYPNHLPPALKIMRSEQKFKLYEHQK